MKLYFYQGAFALVFLFLNFSLQAQVNPHYIWGGPNSSGDEYKNSTFDGGFNDWTTESGTDNPNLVWTWTSDGVLQGNYWDSVLTIVSPTISNGAVAFDSDDYEFNQGQPQPHKSYLISPAMDCSGEANVSVLFHETFRTFHGETSIEVSNDGGASWTSYPILFNDDVDVNRRTSNDAWTHVNISNTAGNQADVRIRFVWEGQAYYWVIDDVSLIRTPKIDFAITDYINPANAYSKPQQTGVSCDSFYFASEIRNVSGVTNYDVQAKVAVIDVGDGSVLYADSTILDTFPDDAEALEVYFEQGWTPPNTVGEFRILYSVSTPEDTIPDFKPEDNDNDGTIRSTYIVNDNLEFSMAPAMSFAYTGVTVYFSVGSYYRTCDIDMDLYIDSIGFATTNDKSILPELVGAELDIYIFKVIDDSKRFPTALYSGMIGNEGGWQNMGTSNFVYSDASQAEQMIMVGDFYSLLGDSLVSLDLKIDPNSEYVIGLEPVTKGLEIGYGIDMHYGVHAHEAGLEPDGFLVVDNTNVYSGFGGLGNPQLLMKLKFLVASQSPLLPENSIRVIQNPVQDLLKLQLDFDHPTDISYAVGTMSGSVIQFGKWENITQGTESLNVSNLPSGNYLLRIQTEDGVATKSFIVIR